VLSPAGDGLLHEFFDRQWREWRDRVAVDIPPGPDRPDRIRATYGELAGRSHAITNHPFTAAAVTASHALVGLVASRELTVSSLLWVPLYVAAGVLLEQPGAPAWQQELSLGVGVFALLMALLSSIESAFGDSRE